MLASAMSGRTGRMTDAKLESTRASIVVNALGGPGRRERATRALTDGAIILAGLALAILFWQLAADRVGRYFPAPLAVFENALDNFASSDYLRGLGLPEGGYLPHIAYTVRTVLVGVSIGFALGLVSGFASWRWRIVDQVFDPIVSIFGTMPIMVAAPLFLIWFGLVAAAQVILVAFYTFMILHLFVLRAVRNVDIKYIESARTLGANDALVFRKIVLPAAIPEIFGGIRVAFASAWGLACVAELLGARFGVGRVIVSFVAVYDVVGMMALIVLVGLVAVILDGLVAALRSYLTRWAQTGVIR
jgi:ABC-type nitrate/sulfonate/bicarbonate transport system permease component